MSLVQLFNALPRKPKAPSGRVPNVWHFDIRYVHLEPTPAHVVAIIQPQSLFFHMESLPVGLSTTVSGIDFFPESAKDAAPAVAKALLHAFVNNLGMGSNDSRPFAPWRLTAEDKDLADAVGEEFRRLGIHSDDLCKIGLSTRSVNKVMQDHFDGFFQSLKKTIRIEDWVSVFITTPTSISFQNSAPSLSSYPRHESSAGEADEDGVLTSPALNYITELQKSRPQKAEDKDFSSRISEQIHSVLRMVAEKPASAVKAEADLGDPEAAFDYGIRLLVGLGCKYDRTLARNYLIKALSSPNASDELKCTAHSALIDWYVSVFDNKLPSRYLFAASHHANVAASLSRRVSPKGVSAPPAVLWFMSRIFKHFSESVPELCYFFKDAQKALEDREAEMTREMEKMEVKRLNNPKRYRCATVGCVIEADSGKMLSRCSGKCDMDKKPSYCSKACQIADWKNHKPFCKPGMPCSVIDTGSSGEGVIPGMLQSQGGAIQVPVTLSGGSTMRLSSSTMDPKFLKEVKDHIEVLSEQSSVTLPQNMTFEFGITPVK